MGPPGKGGAGRRRLVDVSEEIIEHIGALVGYNERPGLEGCSGN